MANCAFHEPDALGIGCRKNGDHSVKERLLVSEARRWFLIEFLCGTADKVENGSEAESRDARAFLRSDKALEIARLVLEDDDFEVTPGRANRWVVTALARRNKRRRITEAEAAR